MGQKILDSKHFGRDKFGMQEKKLQKNLIKGIFWIKMIFDSNNFGFKNYFKCLNDMGPQKNGQERVCC